MQDGGGTFALTSTGALTLSGNNTYSGATTISGGTLKLGRGQRGAEHVCADNRSRRTYDLAGFSETAGALNGAGNVTSSVKGTVNLTAGAVADGAFSGDERRAGH